jgi:putative acyl-CoA dehydrogenase
MHLGEALECLGGYGYIEESRLPRAYREAPLMSVWEGSGNVQALDVLRALQTDPDCAEAVLAELAEAAGANRLLDAAVAALKTDLADGAAGIGAARAREVTGRIARALQAVQLVKFAPAEVADAFCQTRLGDVSGAFGVLPTGVDAEAIVTRATAT